MKPFRFAVQSSGAPTAAAWRDRARQAEDLGYSTLYVPDHLGEEWGPLVAMTVAAEATTVLRVGGLVFDNDYRHPVVLAKEIATLDLVSDGRVEFGLGAGWLRADYDQAGLAYDPPGTRIDRMEEAVDIYRRIWGQPPASFAGSHYRIEDAVGQPRPTRPGGPTLVIGGGGRRVLTVAARHADVVGINPGLGSGVVDPSTALSAIAERFDERVQWVRDAAGDRFDDLELQLLTFYVQVGGDRRAVARTMGPIVGLTEQQAYDSPMSLIGTVDEICDVLHERRERWGFNYWVVHDPEMEAFADVVARLAGT